MLREDVLYSLKLCNDGDSTSCDKCSYNGNGCTDKLLEDLKKLYYPRLLNLVDLHVNKVVYLEIKDSLDHHYAGPVVIESMDLDSCVFLDVIEGGTRRYEFEWDSFMKEWRLWSDIPTPDIIKEPWNE